MLRRLFIVLAALLAPLCALPSSAAGPMLVVFPFAVNGSAPETLGSGVANQIAAEITALGGVQVVRGAASAKPADYRSAARDAGADVYLSGSIVPVFGTSYSAIEQLVSTHSGTVIWSVNTHFSTLADLSGEGGRVRDALLAGSPSPPPGIVADGLSLVTAPPMSGYAVLPVAGSAPISERQYAAQAIVETLQHRGFTAVLLSGDDAIDPAAGGIVECASTKAQALITTTLDTTRVDSPGVTPQTTAHVALRTYDCRTHLFEAQATVVNHIAALGNDAIRGAVEDAVSAFPAS